MAQLLPNVRQTFFDANGLPLVGGQLFSYLAGTATLSATFTDQSGGTPNTNPVILDSAGSANIWIGTGSYKFILKDSLGNVLWTVDNVTWIPSGYITSSMIANGAIGTTQLALLSVTTANIVDQAVTTAKLADNSVTPAKIPDGTIPLTKLSASQVEVVFKNKGDFWPGGGMRGFPQFPWTAPIQAPSLTGGPGAEVRGLAFSPNMEYLAAAAASGGPAICIYQRVNDVYTKLTDPLSLPAGDGGMVTWSPDGNLLAISDSLGSRLKIYQRFGSYFTFLSDPATLPGTLGTGAAFSPTGEFLAVTSGFTPFVTIYQKQGVNKSLNTGSMSGSILGSISDITPLALSTGGGNTYNDVTVNAGVNASLLSADQRIKEALTFANANSIIPTFTKLSNPGTLPAGGGNACAWSPDGQFLAVGHMTTPFLTIYQRSGSTFTKLADPATLPTDYVQSLDWSPDGMLLAIGTNASPYVIVYQRSGTTFTKLTNPATLPPGLVQGVSWSPNGVYLALAHTTTPFVSVYSLSGTTLTKLTDPTVLPAGTAAKAVCWSPDNRYLAIGHNATPYMTVYETSSSMPTNALLYVRQVFNA